MRNYRRNEHRVNFRLNGHRRLGRRLMRLFITRGRNRSVVAQFVMDDDDDYYDDYDNDAFCV